MLFRSNDTATTEIYTLSLHDALPISVKAATVQKLEEVILTKARDLRRTSIGG